MFFPKQDVAIEFPVTFGTYAIIVEEECHRVDTRRQVELQSTDHRAKFLRLPGVESSFLAFRIGIEGCVTSTVRVTEFTFDKRQ